MKKEKILINVENLNEVDEYKKIGINNFLFAVNDYSIGYKSYDINEIKDINGNKFLYLNRILNCQEVDNLKKIKDDILFFDGIIFEDIAVYNIFKNDDINLIWNQSHFATNYSSINVWNDLVYSSVISNELSKDEVKEIINNSTKNLVLNIFGKNMSMYSRRTLLSNFNTNFNLGEYRDVILTEPITNNEFETKESEYGTVLFNNTYFNLIPYLSEFDENKILYYLINPKGLNVNEINSYINGKNDNTNDGFMNKKTIYKLGVK